MTYEERIAALKRPALDGDWVLLADAPFSMPHTYAGTRDEMQRLAEKFQSWGGFGDMAVVTRKEYEAARSATA